MMRIPAPRLLPITIFALAGVLALRSVELARVLLAAGTTVVPSAQAAVEKPAPAPATTAAASAPPLSPSSSPGEPHPKPDEPAPVSDSERAVLLELRQRRQ